MVTARSCTTTSRAAITEHKSVALDQRWKLAVVYLHSLLHVIAQHTSFQAGSTLILFFYKKQRPVRCKSAQAQQ
jgi:hypothetical protein